MKTGEITTKLTG